MKILETKHLKKYYGAGENQVKAVNDINLSIEKGSSWRWSGRLAPARQRC